MIRNPAVEPADATRSQKPAPGAPAFGALLAAAALLAYLPCLRGGLLWDDDAHVTRPELRSLGGLWRIWTEAGATQQYYPLLHSAFWAEHALWGDSVLGYHLVGVLLHACAAFLLFLALRRLSFPAPRLAALVFLLHPVCAESVAWISEQKNTLSAVLYLASALAYLRYDGTRDRRLYSGALALFFLALLTKTVTATLPAALLVVLWWRRGRLSWRRDVAPLAPWFALGAAAGLFTAWMEEKFIGAEGANFSMSFAERLVLAGHALSFYASKVAWPADLMFIYPRWPVAVTAAGWARLLCAVAAGAALAVLARRSRGPLAGFLFFAGTLFPALGFVNVYPFLFSFVADHFQYLASLGIIVPAAWAMDRLAQAGRLGPLSRAACAAAVLGTLGALTFRQARDYSGSETLYRAAIARNPEAWLAHFNLGVILGPSPGHLKEAIHEYQETVRLKPDHWKAHNNLGVALGRLPGHEAESIREFREALRYNPGFADAHNNLGVTLSGIPGSEPGAIAEFRAAVRCSPADDAAYSNLGNVLVRNPADLDEAIDAYRQAARLSPKTAGYHYELANALSRRDSGLAEAILQYEEALRLRPGFVEAHSNLGVALGRVVGRRADAIRELRTALRLAPGSEEVHANLASQLAKEPGGADEAIAEYRAALALSPKDALAHYALGMLLGRDPRRASQARDEFADAVYLDPGSPEAQYALGISIAMTGGSRDEAVGHLRQALRMRPDFRMARRALEQLGAVTLPPNAH
ncbi:MAG TPA: tetratricopeptide repeat protein [Opitutaceae bacterium]|jgi:tetratricopeptide (TPR) repeat protein